MFACLLSFTKAEDAIEIYFISLKPFESKSLNQMVLAYIDGWASDFTRNGCLENGLYVV